MNHVKSPLFFMIKVYHKVLKIARFTDYNYILKILQHSIFGISRIFSKICFQKKKDSKRS